MNEMLLNKLDEFYEEINNNDLIKELLELKNKIYSDGELKELLDKYRNSNKYDPEYISLKGKIINNPLVSRYREIENELYFTTLEINQKLNTLVDKKVCNSENN